MISLKELVFKKDILIKPDVNLLTISISFLLEEIGNSDLVRL